MSPLLKYIPVALAAMLGVIVGVFIARQTPLIAPSENASKFSFGINKGPDVSGGDCDIKEVEKFVSGESLLDILRDGQKIKVLAGYYACNNVGRGDIVVHRYAGNINPIVKAARGIPYDKFDLAKGENGKWNILVNGSPLKNSKGIQYAIGDNAYRMLSLYVSSYNGVIPPGTALILGENPGGSLDSTRFGLVDKSDLIGKVVTE